VQIQTSPVVLYFRFIGRDIADRTQQMEKVILTKVNSRRA